MLLSLFGAIGLALGGANAVLMPTEVAASIRNLESPDFETREEATRFLAAYGPAALPALRQAEDDDSPEVAERASALVVLLTVRAETERLLTAKPYAVSFEAAGMIQTTTEFNARIGATIPTDARVLPSDAKLTLIGSLPFWRIVDDIESTFDLTYGNNAGGAGMWLPKDDRIRTATTPSAFRLTATALPERTKATGSLLWFTLQAEPSRTVVRVESIRLDEIIGVDGDGLVAKDAIVAPPQVDPYRSRMIRGGRIVVAGNGMELIPDASSASLSLMQQQIAVPVVWPADCERIETLSGEIRAQVKGEATELLRLPKLDGGPTSASARAVVLKIADKKPEADADPGIIVTATYLPGEISFPNNPNVETPTNETILINGRARIIVRGQGVAIVNSNRIGGLESFAYHGLKLFAADGSPVRFRVDAPSISYQADGSVVEQFVARLRLANLEEKGRPVAATLTARMTRTISIPFQMKNLPRPKAAGP